MFGSEGWEFYFYGGKWEKFVVFLDRVFSFGWDKIR